MNHAILDLKMPIMTPRLLIRAPQAGDGKQLNEAVIESLGELSKWLPWATYAPSLQESEDFIQFKQKQWQQKEDFMVLIFNADGKKILGCSGLHRFDLEIPKFEIGFWVRSSYANQGIITEATNALTQYAFNYLHAKRVEVRCEKNNLASQRVVEKLHFNKEGTLKNFSVKPNGKDLEDIVVYARYDLMDLPVLSVSW